MSKRPSRFLQALLARAVPNGASGLSLLGDLLEEYTSLRGRSGRLVAGAWYTYQVLSIAVPYALGAFRRRSTDLVAKSVRGVGLDLRYTYRGLRASLGVTFLAVVSLSLGIGFTTAVSTLINGIWFAPLPYPNAERMVDIEDTHATEVCNACSPGTSYASFLDWQRDLSVFDGIAATSGRMRILMIGDRPREVRIAAVSGSLAGLMGVKTRLGRAILSEDELPGAEPVLVLGHGLWVSAFARDLGVIGQVLRVDSVPHTVVGVLDEETSTLDRARAWVALAPNAGEHSYGARALWVVGRLAEGTDVETANEQLGTYAAARYEADPSLIPGWSARARPLRGVLAEAAGPPIVAATLFAATLMVLLIACTNLAALLLARVTERERELGIRMAIGSSRGRLVRVAVLESLALALAGGLVGMVVASLSLGRVTTQLMSVVPGWMTFPIDARVVGSVFAAVLITAVMCGTLPMLRAFAITPGQGMIGTIAGRTSPARLRKHDWLLGAQIALGVILLAGSVAAVRTFLRVSDFDRLGHRYEDLITIGLATPEGRYSDAASAQTLTDQLTRRFEAHPSVTAAIASKGLFLGSWGSADGPSPVWVAGAAEAVTDLVVPRHSMSVSTGYFDLLQIPILAGRAIDASDSPGGVATAVASEGAARALWPDAVATEVLGRQFRVDGGSEEQWFTVVGVSADVVYPRSARMVLPKIYTSLAQTSPTLIGDSPSYLLTFQLDVRGPLPDPENWQALIAEVDPDIAIAWVTTVEEELRQWITTFTLNAGLMTLLSSLALGLLLLGVYGTLSYRIASMRHEIGIRVAMGAQPRALVRAVTGRVARVFALALMVGLLASVPVGAAFRGGELPLGGEGPVSLTLAAGLLLLIGVLACLAPVRRALAIDPIESLKAD